MCSWCSYIILNVSREQQYLHFNKPTDLIKNKLGSHEHRSMQMRDYLNHANACVECTALITA